MRSLILFLTLGLCLIGAAAVGIHMWTSLSGVEISFHGYLAMALGAILTLALGIGLMALVFYSARHGHDDVSQLELERPESASNEAKTQDHK